MQTPPQPGERSLGTLLLMSTLLLGAAAIFAVSGDAPHTFVLTGIGLAVSLCLRRPLPRTVRSFVYAGVVVLAVSVLEDQVFPVAGARFFLLPAHIYCPPIIFIGVAATYFDQRDTNITAVLALALVGTMLAGSMLVYGVENQRFPQSQVLIDHFHAYYATVLGAQMLAMLALIRRVAPRLPSPSPGAQRFRLHRNLFIVTALGAALLGVAGMRAAAFYYTQTMERSFNRMFRTYMRRHARWFVFSSQVDLRRTVPFREKADKTVVLRAVAPTAPGYLRGHVYRTYANGQWTSAAGRARLTATFPGGRYAFTVFRRDPAVSRSTHDAAPQAATMDLYPARNFRSRSLLCPGHAGEFTLIAEGLTDNEDGVLVPWEWDRSAGFSVRLPKGVTDSAYPAPAGPGTPLAPYLQIPQAVEEAVRELAATITGPENKQHRPEQLIARTQLFLRNNFAYALDVAIKPETDPVIDFMTRLRRGHCELFASAAVLLLRAQGVPARYVTGFICAERHPAGTHWLARLEDAHAWAEAYREDQHRWVTVEPTPAAGIPDPRSDLGPVSSLTERLTVFWQELLAQVKRGYFAEAIVKVSRTVWGLTWSGLRHPVAGPLGVLVLFLFVQRWWQARKRRCAAADTLLPPAHLELRRALLKIERHLHRYGLDRAPATTLRELAEALRDAPALPNPDRVAELLHEYEELRYRATWPSTESVTGFAEKVARQLN